MLSSVQPTTQLANKPQGFLAEKADAIVQKVQTFARQTHQTMDQMRFGHKLDVNA